MRYMARYSLVTRAEMIKSMLGLRSFSECSLRNLYKKHKITYRKVEVYRAVSWTNENLLAVRQQYVHSIASLAMANKDLYYYDQCSVSIWLKPDKCWMHKDDQIYVPQAK